MIDLIFICHYRPKRSFGQGNIFTPVCHSVHRGGRSGKETPPAGWRNPPGVPPGWMEEPPRLDGGTPPGWMEEPPRLDGGTPPAAGWRNPPPPAWWRNPPWLDGEPPSWMENPPPPPGWMENPREPDSGIRSTIGRYASYWNAFLSSVVFPTLQLYLLWWDLIKVCICDG